MAEVERKSVEGLETAKVYANKLVGFAHCCLNPSRAH